MKKFTTFAFIILTLFSCVLFSACGDKYKNLKMSFYFTDGTNVNELVLIKDKENPEYASKRIGVKFSNIDEEDIGQVVIYSSPVELVTTSRPVYSGNYYYIDVAANISGSGSLIVKHLSSNKTEKIDLVIEQKAENLIVDSNKYIVAVNGVEEGSKRIHTLDPKELVTLIPSSSTDIIYFKEIAGNTLPSGVKKLTETIDGNTYVTGFEISNGALTQTQSFKLIPVLSMQGYDDEPYEDKVVEIYFKKVINNSNVILDTDEKHKDDDGKIYDVIHLIANDTSAAGEYSYNNVIFNFETIESLGLGDISNYLDDYILTINESASAIQTAEIGNGSVVIQATASTEEIVEVELILTPKNLAGDVETISRIVKVKGEVKADTILAEKNGEEVDVSKVVDIYDYIASGNENGIKFNFAAVAKSGAVVYKDLNNLRIEIAPEILYSFEDSGYWNNIYTDSNFETKEDFDTKKLGVRDISNQKNLIRIFKGNDYLKFYYNSDAQRLISESFESMSNIFIRYEETTNTETNISLKLDVTAKYEGEFKYLKNISKTKIELNFELKEGVKSLDLFASRIISEPGAAVQYEMIEQDNPLKVENVYINKDDATRYQLVLSNKSIKGIDDEFILTDVEFEINISYDKELISTPITLSGEKVVDGTVKDFIITSANFVHINIDVDGNTSVGNYIIKFSQPDTGFEKTINCFIYKDFDVNSDISLDFNNGELNEDAFKNYDGENYLYSDYEVDYIVYAGKTLHLTANINQEVINSNIVKDYSYTPVVLDSDKNSSDDLVLNNYFNYVKDGKNAELSQLNFLDGTIEDDKTYFIQYIVNIHVRTFTNILTEGVGDTKPVSMTFFVYERVLEDGQVKAKLNKTSLEKYMFEHLGAYNQETDGVENLIVNMDDNNLWNYVQIEEGKGNKVYWETTSEDVALTVTDYNSVKAQFDKDNDNNDFYTTVISAYIKQFNRTIPLHCNVLVRRPILTEELRLTSSEPTFVKMSSNSVVNNGIFEYSLDLKEGEYFTVLANHVSSKGEVSHKGVTLVVANSGGSTNQDAVKVEGNKIIVNKIQAGLKLIVYSTDVLNAKVVSYNSGYNRPEQYIMEDRFGTDENAYKKAYFIINLHLEDGERKETAYSIYNLADFEDMLNLADFEDRLNADSEGKFYRIMNDISLSKLSKYNNNFKGRIFSANNQIYTLYGLTLNATNKNLFTSLTGSLEDISFEVEYSYDNSTNSGNLGIIGELISSSTLTNVQALISGTSKFEGSSKEFKFGGLVGVNNGTIQYNNENVTGVKGTITLQGNSKLMFGGLVGLNNRTIAGTNQNATTLAEEGNIIFSTATDTQGTMANINVLATGLFATDSTCLGGIVGKNCGKLSNAYVIGTIKAPSINNVGGAIGYSVITDEGTYERDTETNIVTVTNAIVFAENVKSGVVITANDDVGGIVGYAENGLIKNCWYQILPTTKVAITANNNVGGIIGYSKHAKLEFCSVFSYKYEYDSTNTANYIASVNNSTDVDFYGNNYVAGLVGFVESSDISQDTTNVKETTIVMRSSVNAVIKSKSEDKVTAGIYATADNTLSGIINSTYFIGKLIGTYHVDNGMVLDNKGSALYNSVYTIFINDGQFNTGKSNDINLSSENKNLFWFKNTGLNLGYIHISNDKSEDKPIFDLVPNSFDVGAKGFISTKALNVYYYDFSVSGVSETKIKELNQTYNQKMFIDLLDFNWAPGGDIMVAVKSSDINVINVEGGKMIVNGVGTAKLTFTPVLNSKLAKEVIVTVTDTLSGIVVTENGRDAITTLNIAKDKTKQLQTYSVGVVESTYKYKATNNYGLMIEITGSLVGGKISDYIKINGISEYKTDETSSLIAYIPFGTPLSFTALQSGGAFSVSIVPHINENTAYTGVTASTFTLNTCQGASNISLNYTSAIVYPNDITELIATISTDMPLNDAAVEALIINAYLNGNNIINKGIYISIKVLETWDEDKCEQIVTFTINSDKTLETGNSDDRNILIFNFKTEYSSMESVEYIVLPQKIDKIEAKSYIYTDFANAKIEASEVLKPGKLGLLIIDVAPINGYFDYLEIEDITGNEEITFIQLEGVNGKSLFEIDTPSVNGKGIRLVKVDGQNSIYVSMQIDKNYSSKMHQLKLTAHYRDGSVLNNPDYKYIDVKMLPIIDVEYQLPNGTSKVYDSEKNVDGLYFANGTSANFRITTRNATEPLTYSVTKEDGVSGAFEFVNTHGDFYTLRNTELGPSDLGKTVTINLSAQSIIESNIETTEMTITFTIVNYVIHSFSVTSSNSKGEIYGNFGVESELEVYFNKTDITYLDNGTYHDKVYQYATSDPTDSILLSINNILKELNTNADDYFILNTGLSNEYNRPASGEETGKYETLIDAKITLATASYPTTIHVLDDYDENAHLAVDMELTLNNDKNWEVSPDIQTGSVDLSKNFKLNFNKPYSEDDYQLIKNVEDFLAMESGKANYYILGNDLVLENYAPMDVEIAEFDGNGRTITIKSFAKFDQEIISAGLFKQIYKDMIVKNVNVVYESTRNSQDVTYSFGRVVTNNNISNVKDFTVDYADLCNNRTINYTSAVFGGITPVNNGVITNCTVAGKVALRASTVEINKTSTEGGNYSIDFNIGGLVGTNESTGYITHSTSGLQIYSLANIGGLVNNNKGKIASCSVEDEALIYAYNTNLEKTILVNVGGFVSENSGEISMSHVTLNYVYRDTVTPKVWQGFMSTKDAAAGFVYKNTGDIKNCYTDISKLGDHSNIFCGFVYLNSGYINNSYTNINEGNDSGANIYMFTQDAMANLTDCIEFVNIVAGYKQDSSQGLKTIDYNLNAEQVKLEFDKYNFILGNNSSAVWFTDINHKFPLLVSCEDKVRYTGAQASSGENYFGLRNFIYDETEIENEDGTTSFEYKVVFTHDTYGTKENPFIITTLSNWDNRMYDNSTAYYRIVKDIKFSISGNPTTSVITFSGNIQGNDMTLSNIKLYLQEDVEALGLFKTLKSMNDLRLDNSIRNLHVEVTSAWASKADAMGILSGKSIGFNLYNISVKSDAETIVGGNAVGGVVGYIGGEFDVDGMTSDVGVNSTREFNSYRYNIFSGKNNKNSATNLTSVYYAGSVFGVVDAYNSQEYNFADERLSYDDFYKINHIVISGAPILIGDSVGAAFGFVGERTYVKNVNVTLENAQFKGYQYSAGVAGENRGIIENAVVTIDGDCFAETNYSTAGAVGLNIGGLIKNVDVNVNIIEPDLTVGGIVARNINGVINTVSFDGELFGNITGVIMATNYSKGVSAATIGGNGLYNNDLDLIIPQNSIKYFDSKNPIGFEKLTISGTTLDYFINHIKNFYTYTEVIENETTNIKQNNFRAFGLFVGMTDIDTNTTTPDIFDSFIENVKYDITDKDNVKIILNGETGNTEEKVVGVEFEDGNVKHNKESLYWIKSNGIIVHSDGTEDYPYIYKFDSTSEFNYIKYDTIDEKYYKYIIEEDATTGELKETIGAEWTETIRTFTNTDLTYLTTIYITGVKVSSFDSWDKLAFSSDFVVFGNFS